VQDAGGLFSEQLEERFFKQAERSVGNRMD